MPLVPQRLASMPGAGWEYPAWMAGNRTDNSIPRVLPSLIEFRAINRSTGNNSSVPSLIEFRAINRSTGNNSSVHRRNYCLLSEGMRVGDWPSTTGCVNRGSNPREDASFWGLHQEMGSTTELGDRVGWSCYLPAGFALRWART